eukprot:scaffold318300_cov17-Tisochrysis_lutea.AAC.1
MQVAKVSEQRWKLLTDLGFSASGLPRGDDERDTTPVVIHAHVHYLKVFAPSWCSNALTETMLVTQSTLM